VRDRPSDRVRVRRNPKKGRYERARIEAILDRSLVGHVAFVDRGAPICIPTLYVRIAVVAFGRFHEITGDEERLAALAAFTNKLLPGRWSEVRQPNTKELKGTMLLAMEIEEASAKVRSGPPDDDDSEDAALDVWAGEIPIVHSFGAPVPSPGLRHGIAIAETVKQLVEQRASRNEPDHDAMSLGC
jgi:uncharacterized protein